MSKFIPSFLRWTTWAMLSWAAFNVGLYWPCRLPSENVLLMVIWTAVGMLCEAAYASARK